MPQSFLPPISPRDMAALGVSPRRARTEKRAQVAMALKQLEERRHAAMADMEIAACRELKALKKQAAQERAAHDGKQKQLVERIAELDADAERERGTHAALVSELERTNRIQLEAAKRTIDDMRKKMEAAEQWARVAHAAVYEELRAEREHQLAEHERAVDDLNSTRAHLEAEMLKEREAHAAALAERDAREREKEATARERAVASVGRLWNSAASSAVVLKARDVTIDELNQKAQSDAEKAQQQINEQRDQVRVWPASLGPPSSCLEPFPNRHPRWFSASECAHHVLALRASRVCVHR